MNFNYRNHQIYLKGTEYDEFIARGISYLNSPSLFFLHERIMWHLQELSFYLVRLNKLGINNEKIKNDVIEACSSMVVNIDYTPEYFSRLISRLYMEMVQAKELYISVCQKNNLEFEILKTKLKDPQKLSLSEMIQQGQKSYTQKTKKLTPDQEFFTNLLFNIGKNFIIYLVALREFGIDNEIAYQSILLMFDSGNTYINFTKIESINEFMRINNFLLKELENVTTETYGEITTTEVSTSIRPNKAILVTGSNLKELELILEETKDKGIDIYTHDNLIVAHAYPKLKTYPHLIGHIGENTENYLIDFNNFPGSILMTKHSLQRVENLYRGGIYTTDIIAPPSVVIIENNDFEPLIKSALRAEGFKEKTQKPPIKLNFSEKDFLEKITAIAKKIESGEIKHFFVIGSFDGTQAQKEYFDKFLNLLGNDSFVLSFSYISYKNNVLFIRFNDNWFINFYKALDILTQNIKIENLNPIILYTKWGLSTFPNVVYMKNLGINKIYLPDCSPNLFNPFFIDGFKKIYDLKIYTNPQDDLNEMLTK